MNLYRVKAVYPCGHECTITVTPGAPFIWPNKGEFPPNGEGKRAVRSMADAVEYVGRVCLHQTSPIDFEYPASVVEVETVDSAKTPIPAAVKALLNNPKKAGE